MACRTKPAGACVELPASRRRMYGTLLDTKMAPSSMRNASTAESPASLSAFETPLGPPARPTKGLVSDGTQLARAQPVSNGVRSTSSAWQLTERRTQVCATVDRSRWTAQAEERGLVYCEDGHCVLVPTVCRNVSRIERLESQRTAAPAPSAAGADLAHIDPPIDISPGAGSAAGPGLRWVDLAAPSASPPAAQQAAAAGPAAPQPLLTQPDDPMSPYLPPAYSEPRVFVTLPAVVPAVPELPTWLLLAGGVGLNLQAADTARIEAHLAAGRGLLVRTEADQPLATVPA